ncbi:MAG: tetratricopeptide repeat protein [Clostridium sp.]|jgi:hypothetical protein|nr:tetratricopeptide repeat protein [Clostridium sp.]
MLKTDFKKEIESTLDLIKIGIDKDLIDGDIEESFKKIDRGMKGLLGLDIATIDTLSFNSIVALISKENQYNADRYMALGELLYFQGYIYEHLSNESGKINYYKKAVKSFCEAYKEDNVIDEKYKSHVIEMLDFLNQYDLELDEKIIMFKLYECVQHFDKAEDVLFSMINQSGKERKVINEGIEFYNRLKNIDEGVLEQGNLPLEEVLDSLEELKNM